MIRPVRCLLLILAVALGAAVTLVPDAPSQANDTFERYEFFHRDAGTAAKRGTRASRGPVGLPFLSEIFGGSSERIITTDPEFDQIDSVRQYPVKSIFDDSTLRPGDMVVTERGVQVYRGRRGDPVGPEDFEPVDIARMPRSEREFLAAIDRQQLAATTVSATVENGRSTTSAAAVARIRLNDRLPDAEARPAQVRIIGDAVPVIVAE